MVLAASQGRQGQAAGNSTPEPAPQACTTPCPAAALGDGWSQALPCAGSDAMSLLNASHEESPIMAVIADALLASLERSKLSAGESAGLPSAARPLTVFHGHTPPPISIRAYVERLGKYSRCSPACFVMAFAYMDALAQKDPLLQPCHLSVHRLLLAGVMVAAKFTDDGFFNNAFYAKIGGVTTLELNALELEILRLLDFRLYVKPELLLMYTQQLRALASKKRSNSGFSGVGDERNWQRKALPSAITEAAAPCECTA